MRFTLAKATILFLSLLFCVLPLLKYESLHTTYYDLGLYAQQFHEWRIGDGVLIGRHINFFLPPIALFYNSIPDHISTHSILLLQSCGLIYSAFLVWKIYGRFIATLYFLSYPVWILNLFDFHFEWIALILLLFFFKYNRNKQYILAAVFAGMLALVKEPYALTALFCGLYIYFGDGINRDHRIRSRLLAACFLIVFSVAYFLVASTILSPLGSSFDALESNPNFLNSISRVCANIFNSATFFIGNVLTNLGEYNRWFFVIAPFTTFCFIPLLGSRALLILLPTLVIPFASTNPLHSKINSHYVSIMMVVFCEATFIASQRYKQYLDRLGFIANSVACAPGVIFAVFVLLSIKYNYIWSFSSGTFDITARDTTIKNVIIELFENDHTSTIAFQNSITYYPLYNRTSGYPLSDLLSITSSSSLPEYIIIDSQRPYFLGDISCRWRFGACTDLQFNALVSDQIKYIKSNYRVFYQYDGFTIYKSI